MLVQKVEIGDELLIQRLNRVLGDPRRKKRGRVYWGD